MSEWFAHAACRGIDPELFFPERGAPGAGREAKAVCAGCEVRQECLDYALANQECYGVWGGTSSQERQRMWRPTRTRTCAACGRQFQAPARNPTKCCSEECRQAARAAARAERERRSGANRRRSQDYRERRREGAA